MSIYRGRTGLIDYEDVHETAVGRNVPVPLKSRDASPESRDWLRHRKANPVNHVLPVSERWLDQLPLEVCPRELARHFPRIVNLIALQWNDPDGCSAYFEALFVDRRGARQGFPVEVHRDLLRLREHWYTRD